MVTIRILMLLLAAAGADDGDPAADWEVYTTLAHPTITPDGAVWWVTAGTPPQLRCDLGRRIQSFPLDIGGLPHKDLWYLASDTKGRVWAFGNSGVLGAAFFDRGVWRSFRTLDNAFRIVAREEKGNPGFRIGDPHHLFYPAFAGDGRVAYRESNRLAYFDGTWWDPVPFGIFPVQLDIPPFYVDGVLTAKTGEQYRQFRGGQWQPAQQVIDCPYRKTTPRDDSRRALIDRLRNSQQSISVQDNAGTTWTILDTELCRTLDDVTVRFPMVDDLLRSMDHRGEVFAGAQGSTWLIPSSPQWSGGARYRGRLAVHRPKQDPPGIEWDRRPPDLVKVGSVSASVRVSNHCGRPIVRYQCNDGSWRRIVAEGPSFELHLGYPPDGVHTLRVRAYDGLLRPSETLTHTFEVKRDSGTEVTALVELLGSDNFDERETAARALVQIGKAGLPILHGHFANVDAGRRWWLQAVLDEINQGDRK